MTAIKPVEVLTVKQVAAALQVSTRTIYEWVRKGEFPAPAKIFGLTRWKRDDVERYVEQCFAKARGTL